LWCRRCWQRERCGELQPRRNGVNHPLLSLIPS
jgi:hypothetical protein